MSVQSKHPKIFISHSSLDKSYVSYLVRLLELLGLTKDNMFCSSANGYGIPLNEDIYDYLKQQFREFDLRVLFILSDNYYNSVASMNEMGAAWVLQHKYTSVLLPHFEYQNIKGAIDPQRVSIKLDAPEAELIGKLNQLKDTLAYEFQLTSVNETIWEVNRNEFINKVKKTSSLWAQLRWLQNKEKPASEWLSYLSQLLELDSDSFDILYMLGIQNAKAGNYAEAVNYLRQAVKATSDSIMQEKVIGLIQSLLYQ